MCFSLSHSLSLTLSFSVYLFSLVAANTCVQTLRKKGTLGVLRQTGPEPTIRRVEKGCYQERSRLLSEIQRKKEEKKARRKKKRGEGRGQKKTSSNLVWYFYFVGTMENLFTNGVTCHTCQFSFVFQVLVHIFLSGWKHRANNYNATPAFYKIIYTKVLRRGFERMSFISFDRSS